MGAFTENDLLLIRHAPVAEGGRLNGRRDVAARLDGQSLAPLRARLEGVAARLVSPALRCRQTAAALWPGADIVTDARLWEQDFGQYDGAALGDLPDLGPLSLRALAEWRYPGGESFEDMAARVRPVLEAPASGPQVIVAHAGTVRAALGLALGEVSQGLTFDVAPLSLTWLKRFAGGMAIVQTNWTP